ncbi:hypothetical protein GCM10017673_44350 [Streptosporangium violaceochromogenes]|nr:hypothetical protein GCM10017673_44350 [Streptosporangium violaceochromogenes]
MPTYQYACSACGNEFDIVQKFSDDALTECPACSGELRKVFSAVGIVFKGSGFYRTDSRSSSSSTVGSATSSASGSTETKSADSAPSASPSTESKPAATSSPAPAAT